MKAVRRFQTLDGSLHETAKRAEAYAENLYGKCLSTLAHRLARIDKYSVTMDFLDANLDMFIRLKSLKDAITLEPQED